FTVPDSTPCAIASRGNSGASRDTGTSLTGAFSRVAAAAVAAGAALATCRGDDGVADAGCAGEASAALAGTDGAGVALSGCEDAEDVGTGLGVVCVVAGEGCCIAGGTGVEGRATGTSGCGVAWTGCNDGSTAADATATGEPGREVSSAAVVACATARSSVL